MEIFFVIYRSQLGLISLSCICFSFFQTTSLEYQFFNLNILPVRPEVVGACPEPDEGDERIKFFLFMFFFDINISIYANKNRHKNQQFNQRPNTYVS